MQNHVLFVSPSHLPLICTGAECDELDAEAESAAPPAAPHQDVLCRGGAAVPQEQTFCACFRQPGGSEPHALLWVAALSHRRCVLCLAHSSCRPPANAAPFHGPPQVWIRQHETKEETVLFQELPHALRNEVAWQACKAVFK